MTYEKKCEPDLDLPFHVGPELPLTEDNEKNQLTRWCIV